MIHIESPIYELGRLTVIRRNWSRMGEYVDQLRSLRECALRGLGIADDQIIDEYDKRSDHIMAFDAGQLFGAYRLLVHEPGDIQRAGPSGQLFHFPPDSPLSNSVVAELGRAVLLPSHQRQHASLLVLWRAIARIVLARPEIEFVVGPVTVPSAYPKEYLRMLAAACSLKSAANWLESVVPLINPEYFDSQPCATFEELRTLDVHLRSVGAVTRVPILLRQYQRIGCEFTRFGRWPQFGQAYVTLGSLEITRARLDLLQ
ncbi:GNAT family N-acyltransferase [Achromobacter insolitus]|uniref:GNAT family N-acyltransferase n=1 Tax=Achromobacter insolitus TaxID=217204 RepID=UPI00244EDC8D|nr:GNAT family N-acyltransferase [Achromobacter insolitus]MDH3062313.1 GNAT family N-acyltransferase [Achromobacter insolitus]